MLFTNRPVMKMTATYLCISPTGEDQVPVCLKKCQSHQGFSSPTI